MGWGGGGALQCGNVFSWERDLSTFSVQHVLPLSVPGPNQSMVAGPQFLFVTRPPCHGDSETLDLCRFARRGKIDATLGGDQEPEGLIGLTRAAQSMGGGYGSFPTTAVHLVTNQLFQC